MLNFRIYTYIRGQKFDIQGKQALSSTNHDDHVNADTCDVSTNSWPTWEYICRQQTD